METNQPPDANLEILKFEKIEEIKSDGQTDTYILKEKDTNNLYFARATHDVVTDSNQASTVSIDHESNIAFFKCSSLEEVTFPSSLRSIGDNAFSRCSSLEEITLPSSLISIGESAFYGCSSLEEITLPSSLRSIGESAFENCSSLTQISIPSSVTSIGNNAFYDCYSLSELSIPKSLEPYYENLGIPSDTSINKI